MPQGLVQSQHRRDTGVDSLEQGRPVLQRTRREQRRQLGAQRHRRRAADGQTAGPVPVSPFRTADRTTQRLPELQFKRADRQVSAIGRAVDGVARGAPREQVAARRRRAAGRLLGRCSARSCGVSPMWREPSSCPSAAGPSTFRTSAPRSSRCRVASGPGSNRVKSMTRTPASGRTAPFIRSGLHATTWSRPTSRLRSPVRRRAASGSPGGRGRS